MNLCRKDGSGATSIQNSLCIYRILPSLIDNYSLGLVSIPDDAHVPVLIIFKNPQNENCSNLSDWFFDRTLFYETSWLKKITPALPKDDA